ncbi:hypothetical protein SAMN02745146_2574 [Hymenobacter daecheongensis DSM 21074]|uniref:GTPase n=1 Tax=Hymenobacter daecheongensis DSM 21074 TaxID=1121955 RepID=A0A1M6HNC0_9BACT|nr:hypothetical protein [Hymenobacter daecheongensis]SHJ23702.1 hypothetical protein SAMN02745146_2574 [Hymenobacter daecheongensis DSM 21074]
MPETLLFVYNADSGLGNAVLDLLHKTLSPRTYACSLCALTYGVRMQPEWREFLQQLPITPTFLHRDELPTRHPELASQPLPAAFLRTAGGSWQPFLTPQELNQTDLPGLMDLVRERLSKAGLATDSAASETRL